MHRYGSLVKINPSAATDQRKNKRTKFLGKAMKIAGSRGQETRRHGNLFSLCQFQLKVDCITNNVYQKILSFY